MFLCLIASTKLMAFAEQPFPRPMVSADLKLEGELPNELEEASGVIFWRNAIWTINDSGGEAVIYKINLDRMEVSQRIYIQNAQNIDWEDITQDKDYIYVGDFGDNSGTRSDLRVLKIAKADVPESGTASLNAEFIYFSYKGKPSEVEDKHNYDCEAFVAMGNHLYLFSKNRGDLRTYCYKLSKTPGTYSIERISNFNAMGLVTGADYDANTNKLVLVGYPKNYTVPFVWCFWDFSGDDFFNGQSSKVDFVYHYYRQMEGVTFYDDFNLYLVCETTDFWNAGLYSYNSKGIVTDIIDFDVQKGLENFEVVPNPSKPGNLYADFTFLPKGNYTFRLVDMQGHELFIEKYRFKNKKDRFQLKISTEGFKPGIYLLQISSGKKFASRKVIILLINRCK